MAKSKKDMLAELYKAQPTISAEDAAAAVDCTVAYAKRILPTIAAISNSEIVDIGRGLGIPAECLDEWHDWILQYINSPTAAKEFLIRHDLRQHGGAI